MSARLASLTAALQSSTRFMSSGFVPAISRIRSSSTAYQLVRCCSGKTTAPLPSRRFTTFSDKVPVSQVNTVPINKHAIRQVQTNPKLSEEHIVSVIPNHFHKWLEVTWKDGYSGRYPYVWLRDNCRCPSCYYPSCHQRSMLVANLDLTVKPRKVELDEAGQNVEIAWSDNHTSPFSAEWLKLHKFEKSDFDPIKKLSTVSWGSEFVDQIPRHQYDDVMTSNKALYDWLENLITYGLVLIKGAPAKNGVMKKLCERVAYSRTTCYGPQFLVESLFDSSSLGLTTYELGLHVDLPFYDHRPCTQLLHCIRQCETKGGESQYVDAKRVAEQIQREDPELFEIMTTVLLDFRCLGTDFVDFHLQQARTMIELDKNGEFKTLAYNDQVRAPYMNIPVEQVTKVYEAIKMFNEVLYREENHIEIKLQEGDIVAFDNNRVLHGRSAFTVNVKDGEMKSRLLDGGYLDWDEIYSRMRLIYEELHGTPRL